MMQKASRTIESFSPLPTPFHRLRLVSMVLPVFRNAANSDNGSNGDGTGVTCPKFRGTLFSLSSIQPIQRAAYPASFFLASGRAKALVGLWVFIASTLR